MVRQNNQEQRSSTLKKHKKFKRWFWGIFIGGFSFIIILFILISEGYFGYMPSFEDLENPENNLSSHVYSTDNRIIGSYYIQNRTYVKFDELCPPLVNGLIATEDIRFRQHSGVDLRGLFRVLFKTVMLGFESSGGGSTITQQLAKNLFPRDTTTYDSKYNETLNLILAKFKEWITAAKLERNYTKKEILVMYFNTVPFGYQAYGIKSASKTYFNKEPDSLDTEEAALLVGMLKAPSWYNPVRNPERAQDRRNIVLYQMQRYDFITQSEYDSLQSLPIKVNYNKQTHYTGLAPYFREFLRQKLTAEKPEKNEYYSYHSYLRDSIRWENDPVYGWCNKHVKPNGSNYNLYRDGLNVYTTLNYKMQKYAEEAVESYLGGHLQDAFFKEQKQNQQAPFSKNLEEEDVHNILMQSIRRTDRYYQLKQQGYTNDSIIFEKFKQPREMKVWSWEGKKDTVMSPLDSIKYYKHFLRSGFMSMDPKTGHVKAYVGGINFRLFQYDHVTQSKRQVGSTIKPFLYTLAMQEGYTPCDKVPNVPTTFYLNDTIWRPKNAGDPETVGKYITLKYGLSHSINYLSAWIVKQFQPQPVVDLLHQMGIDSELQPVPSISLGTPEISLYEMVRAYCVYANKGVYTKPLFVTRIEDKNHNVIATFKTRRKEVISEETAYTMIQLLQEVVNHGTGIRLRYRYNFQNEIGGKTGTTQNQSDGWFMGLTPQLVSGVWVGGENRAIHFKDIKQGQGANMALPIWAEYMKRVYDDKSLRIDKNTTFSKPKGYNINLECDSETRNDNESDYMNEQYY